MMRITCPNCMSKYDVDPAMIPAKGRDVQCSSCAHTWLQMPENADAGAHAPKTSEAAVATDPAIEPPNTPDAQINDDEPDIGVIASADASEKLHEATQNAKHAEPTPEPEPEDVLASVRDAVAATDDAPPEIENEPGADVASRADTVEAAAEDQSDADYASSDLDAVADAVNTDADAGSDTAEDMADDAFKDAAALAQTAEQALTATSDEMKVGAGDRQDQTATAPNTVPGAALDDDIAGILREEAEREVSQRRNEDALPALEPQSEMALDDGPPSDLLRERLDRMRSDGVPQSTVAATLKAAKSEPLDTPRRERLPDIEEIKTTLRPGEISGGDADVIGQTELKRIRQSGFRLGFSTLVIAAGLAVAAYVFAPQIIGAIPSSEPAMITYVDAANGVRDGIDRILARAISGINGISTAGSEAS